MTATFLVTIELPVTDPTTLQSVSEEMTVELQSAGMAIVEVKPWARQQMPATDSGFDVP